MKKLFTLFALCVFAGLFAQHKVADKVAEYKSHNAKFSHFSILTQVDEIPSNDIAKAVDNATFAKINMTNVSDIAARKYETIEVEVPYNGSTILVELYNVNPFNENFHVDTNKATNVSYVRGAYYRGIIKGDSNSVASFSFFNNEMTGIVSGADINNLVIGKLDKAQNVNDYIVYSDSKMKVPNGFNCSVKEDTTDHSIGAPSSSRQTLTNKCVTMYFEVDYDLYLQNNSNTTQTTNWITAVYNNVQTLYANDGITTSLKSLYIWTEQDPYEGAGDGSADYLYLFNATRPVFDGDVGQLVGIDAGGLGGVAVDINGLCSQYNFSYSDVFFSYSTVPTYSWTVQVITHEMGHLLGSRHTHACVWNGNGTSIDGCGTQAGFNEGNCPVGPIPSPSVKGTIMSYCHLISGIGISFNNGFGPLPSAAIASAVNNSGCLSTDCINTCINTVVDINVTNVTTTSALVTWNDVGGATSWEISVAPYNTGNSTWTTVNTPSFAIPGPLAPNSYYHVNIRPVCSDGEAFDREVFFVTAANWCSGVLITDTGGLANDYGDMQTYVRTIIPNVPQKKIRLDFTAFDLEADYDYLHLYNGPDTSSDYLGQYTGDFIITPVISSSPDGALTMMFFSDQAVTESGYSATVTCLQNLDVPGYAQDIDFTYYPNPSNGYVTILSNTAIREIVVYNPEGRLLYQSTNNGFEKKVDVSAFATGTYFFKLKFEDKEANFKIIKN
jgi:hypothetical protein